jgi:hypothetical protein
VGGAGDTQGDFAAVGDEESVHGARYRGEGERKKAVLF